MGVHRLPVVEPAQRREVAAVDRAAVGMDELAQRKLVEHLLQQGLRRGHHDSQAAQPTDPIGRIKLTQR